MRYWEGDVHDMEVGGDKEDRNRGFVRSGQFRLCIIYLLL